MAFHQYYKTLFGNAPQHLSDNWLTWFIGFVEGDGAIQTYGNGTRVRFVLTQKESAILFHIEKMLGIGTVKHFPQGTSGNKNDFNRWVVDNPSHILLLAFLFNGNLALNHRIQQLALWIQFLNNRFGANTILLINTTVSVTLQDAWLCGFTDAEGCFNVSIISNAKYSLGAVLRRISLMCLQLSNSGNILKFMVPNGNRKATSGCVYTLYKIIIDTNSSCMVISQMMTEREIDNRGSKSIMYFWLTTIITIVKEQRVNGSWREKYNTSIVLRCFSRLRCILMGFERNYQIRVLYKQINKDLNRFYSSSSALQYKNINCKSNLCVSYHKWLTGFTDGEGSFSISIVKSRERKVGWMVLISFQINLHERDLAILQQIKNYFGVGKIYKQGLQSYRYSVHSVKDFQVIILHFDQYPLLTQKLADYLLFKEVLDLILNKEHLTKEGLKKIVAIKGSMNLGLSQDLKIAFNDVVPVERPLNINQKVLDPYWIAGFATAEGCFFINLHSSPGHKLKERVKLRFKITQHYRDEQLMRSLIEFFGCGAVYKRRETFEFEVTKFSDLTDKIIPLFKKYSILGVKSEDFEDFCKVAEIMKKNAHLTEEGINKIRKIKAGELRTNSERK